MNRTLVIVARQPGSAAAFVPLIRALREDEGLPCLILGLDHAPHVWHTAGIATRVVTSFTEALPDLTEIQPAALLTGTSLNVSDDRCFWKWAKEQNISSLAFVDHWTNYRQRFFATDDSHGDCLPDRIAVIDDLMAQRLVAAGCPEPSIIIAGHPGWDELIPRRDDHAPELRRALTENNSILILFISEPLTRYYGPRGTNSLGYTEIEALSLLCNVLNTVGEHRGETYTVAIKLHPREDPVAFNNLMHWTSSRVRVRVVAFDRLDLVAAAEVVTGMNSILLYEAALMGRPVVALQPGRIGTSDLVDHHPCILLATDYHQALWALISALAGKIQPIPAWQPVIPQWISIIRGLIHI